MQAAFRIAVLLVLGCCSFGRADDLTRRTWTVEGVEREALVYAPADAKAAPLLFAFHGHGGSMRQAAASFGYHRHWPEAVVVYMQGLNTPGVLTDPEGKRAGWQRTVGDQGDRDLKFFDAVLATLQADYRVDPQRVYATGHSNGGALTYLLWAARGDRLAAVAPSGAAARPALLADMKPKPALHVAGQSDPLVRFAWQERTITAVRQRNGCGDGEPWGEYCTHYPSAGGTPLVTYIHPGGHQFPQGAAPVIVRFFKEQVAAGDGRARLLQLEAWGPAPP